MPYQRKPAMGIRAFRLGQKGKPTPAPPWFGSPHPSRITDLGLFVPSSRGDVLARWGDWIVLDEQGELSALAPETFAATFEWRNE